MQGSGVVFRRSQALGWRHEECFRVLAAPEPEVPPLRVSLERL